MIVFDTDSWAAGDRVERWREEFGRHVIRADVVALAPQPTSFEAELDLPGSDLDAAQSVTVSLAMSEVVLVSGTPTLTLNSGGSLAIGTGNIRLLQSL